MKQMPVCFFLILILFSSCANGTGEKTETAMIQSDTASYTTMTFTDTVVNFGTINMRELTKIRFEFSNTGNHPLYLTEVKPGCGCTVAEYTKGAIPAGGKGTIIAAFDSNKAHPGTVSKNIYVTANTSNGLLHTLIFNGEIREQPSATN
jgi:hypothetical protein